MIDTLFEIIAPHHCKGCSKNGSILCDNCKYDIEFERFSQCIVCGCNAYADNLCRDCDQPFSRAWCVGERSGVLQQLIGVYKFQSVRGAAMPLARLLADTIGDIPLNTVVVPIPTVAAHIRERGFDHTKLIARKLGDYRHLRVQSVLGRSDRAKQRGADRKMRHDQARKSFRLRATIKPDIPYLLIDDVTTTGATLHYAARELRAGGAKEVWVAVIARQPLD